MEEYICPYCGEEMEEDFDGWVLVCPNRMCRFSVAKIEIENGIVG